MDNRIYRSRVTKMLGGVCGGIADMYNMDPTLVRLVAVVLTFLTGFAFLLVYIMCAIIIPLEPEPGYILRRHQQPMNNGFSQPAEPSPTAQASQVQEEMPVQPVGNEGKQAPPAQEQVGDDTDAELTDDREDRQKEMQPVSSQPESVDVPLADNDETVVNTEADRY